jgi:hypothetical protein
MAINVPAIALARGEVAPDNREVLWEDTSNMNLPFYERVKAYDSNSTQWRMVTQFPLELLNELRKVDGDGSGLDANFLQGRTVNDIIQLAKDGSFTLPSGFIFIGDSLGNSTARELSGDATLQNTGALILAASGVTAGTYNLATVTVDAKGRVTSASSYTITVDDIPELPQSKITGLVTDLGNRELLANKENSVIDTSTTKYPTVNLLKIGLDGKQDTLVSGTNIKTINSESLLGAGNITINSQNLATNNLTQTDANRTYDIGTGNRTLKFLSGANEKVNFHTDGGNPTIEAFKRNSGPAIKVNKVSGAGNAFEVVGGTSDFGSNKLINVADPTNPQDAVTLAYYSANMYGGKRYTLIKPNGTKEFYDTLTQVRSNWADGDVLHQFADETITFSSTINVPTINWNGNGFSLICNGEITINSSFFLATGKSVNTCFLNLLFTGNAGTNRFFVSGTSSNIWNGNSSTDISCQSDIIVMRETSTSIFLNINSNRNTGNAVVLSSGGGGAYFNIKSKGGVVGDGNKVYNSFFDDNFIDASGSFFDCYGSTLTSQMKSSVSTALRLYGCYLEVKTTGTLTTYNFNTSGAGILEMHHCTYVENQRRSFSVASSNCKFTNNKIYNYSGICGLFNTASFEFNNNYVYAKNLGLSSNSNSTANLINNFIISEVANPVGFGNFKILGGTLQVLTAAQNYLADNHEFVGVNFIGSTSPFPANGYQNNAFRLTQNADHLGNVGLGLKSPFPKMTTDERDALTGVEKGYTIENTTTNFLQVYNGSTWKDLLDLT